MAKMVVAPLLMVLVVALPINSLPESAAVGVPAVFEFDFVCTGGSYEVVGAPGAAVVPNRNSALIVATVTEGTSPCAGDWGLESPCTTDTDAKTFANNDVSLSFTIEIPALGGSPYDIKTCSIQMNTAFSSAYSSFIYFVRVGGPLLPE